VKHVPSTPVRRPLLVLLSASLLGLGCGLSEFPARTWVDGGSGGQGGTAARDAGTVAPPIGAFLLLAVAGAAVGLGLSELGKWSSVRLYDLFAQ
jgi:hypothetical protein